MCGMEWEDESKAGKCAWSLAELVQQLVNELEIVHIVSDVPQNLFKQPGKTVRCLA